MGFSKLASTPAWIRAMNAGGRDRVDRRLAAILAADVVGYSRLMGTDEVGTLERLKAHRSRLIDPKIQGHRGRIVKTTGDGMLVEFASVVDAVSCAVEVQRGMADRNSDIPEDQRIRFRIGVNLGDIIVEGDDIFGDGVNVAARLEALAEPGGICISRVVRDQIRDKLTFAFDDMGEQTVKNIARPVRAYGFRADAIAELPAVTIDETVATVVRRRSERRPLLAGAIAAALIAVTAGGWWAWSSRSERAGMIGTASQVRPVPPLSIVVLPFDNLSKDPDQEYFADGVTDDLTTDLSRIAGSFVIARTTAFTYKGKAINAKQIGRDLGVRYLLEGSVRRSGTQVHVNVQLIDAASESHIWADQFDTDRANLVETQSQITGRLANTLNVALVRDAGRRVAEQKSIDTNAQDLVLRGRDWYSRPASAETLRQAYQLFSQALQIDPRSIDAKIGLASVLATRAVNRFSDSAEQDEATAEQLLIEVLDRDPDRATAHTNLGYLLRVQGSLTASKVQLETALQLDPNSSGAHRQLGFTLLNLGQPAAGLVEGDSALRLNPRDPFLWGTYQLFGVSYLYLGQFDRAVEFLVKSRDENPRVVATHWMLAAALAMKGDLDAGKAELKKWLELKPEASSLEYFREHDQCAKSPDCRRLREQTFFEGLRRLDLPDK